MKAITEGALLWEPTRQQIENAGVSHFMNWLENEKNLFFNTQSELWKWSVDELESFWESVWKYCNVISHAPYDHVLEERKMPGAKWFTGSKINYAEHVFRNDKGDQPALIFQSEITPKTEISW